MLNSVLAAILPIILNVAVGYFLAKRGFLDHNFLSRFSALTFRFFIPCLLFGSIYQADITLLRLAQYWSGYFVPILIAFLLLSLLQRPLLGLTTVYANTVMVGIPLVVQLWGNDGLNIAVAVISLNSLTLFMAYALFSSLFGRGTATGRMLQNIGNTLTNPIIMSLVVGASLNLLHIPLYGPLVESAVLAGRAALPCSLLILGTSLAGMPMRIDARDLRPVLLISLVKLIAIPAAVYFFASTVLHLPAITSGVLLVLAACPCGVNVLPFAQKNAADRQMVSTAIFVSTVIAVVTLPVWVWWVG